MENTKIFLENGEQSDVSGIFYIFNSKYYFIYTQGEFVDDDYVHLYIIQVCKETQNTPTGPVETGYMLGIETTNEEEWKLLQTSITKIVDDKKNGTVSSEIQYLPINMLVNLKIVSKNKFRLMSQVLKDVFKLELNIHQPQAAFNSEINKAQSQETNNNLGFEANPKEDIIIDYRAKFFEEQDKNKELEEQVSLLQEKLNNIKNLIG